MRENIEIDDVTYEIHTDKSPGLGNKRHYIRSNTGEFTDNMVFDQCQAAVNAMRQLGFTVIDRSC